MYSRKAWGGDVDPFILTKFVRDGDAGDSDPLVSLVIFEWSDEALIGRTVSDDADSVNDKLCEPGDIGSFILAPNASESEFTIVTQAVHLNNPAAINYPVKKTGFYCVSTYGYSGRDYKAVVEFRNAYGELPAAQIAKLPFYGGLTIVYALIGVYVHTNILQYFEVYTHWTQNRHGLNVGAKVLMVIVAVLNAGRNAFSFFLLLIVCMGYGVVKPSLGRAMIYVRILAIGHFIFAVIYAVASLSITPDSAGPLVLLIVLPLAGTLTAFYVWTLNSLNATMKDLIDRKQKVKALMYKKLWWCILGSIIVIFGFFFINSIAFAGRSEASFVPEHWKSRWFVLDGWLNLVYLFDIGFVAYLWRPTANNRRFAMSDELDEEDALGGIPESSAHEQRRDLSPVPPKPVPAAPRQRESLDGETIFAVGEDGDKWSDDEDDLSRDSGERKRLTGKDA
ncbi:unnamed protein product [Aspergillus oryzae]|uniref:Unnamed protein product n=2 Tax=Aspergillus oryzae TaxID=5062 RepID=A0AAN4YQI3_ASPOZ|nr:unnamed protein product [Aspergillus oryzae]GMF95511.1 unnamed protein product [Aspergillus oryzae]GMG06673.1 unnamed protein product [Aspergillus oryzae]GMG31875.1 unnamed protein product [Aspergillus oryzae]GMG52245.1 unnamed protein product [Aspergillus oryzae var. brunneus]